MKNVISKNLTTNLTPRYYLKERNILTSSKLCYNWENNVFIDESWLNANITDFLDMG